MPNLNTNKRIDLIKLRDISSAFSRRAFTDILNYNDYSHFNWLLTQNSTIKCSTYFELLEKSYSLISKYYKCEYVYRGKGSHIMNLLKLIFF